MTEKLKLKAIYYDILKVLTNEISTGTDKEIAQRLTYPLEAIRTAVEEMRQEGLITWDMGYNAYRVAVNLEDFQDDTQ